MKLFSAYIRQRRGEISAFILFGAVFCVSFFLYRIPMRAVVYPVLLCALLGGVLMTADFLRVRGRHRKLRELREMTAAMIREFPEISGIEAADYQAIIRALREEAADAEANASARYEEMIEYYTLWVHQIKTPITSMRLTLEQEDSALSRKLSSDLFQIEQYVEMVLAYLRLGSESGDYVFREYRLDEIIGRAVAKFASEFIARRIRLDYEPVEASAVTDDKWLSFVIEQVLSNALKYTREGSVRIWLREPKTLCIADTGIGILPEDLPRVFEKGYTGYNGRRDRRASGIGLYLCRKICAKLGIRIEIDSEPGKGTCVSLDLEQYALKKE